MFFKNFQNLTEKREGERERERYRKRDKLRERDREKRYTEIESWWEEKEKKNNARMLNCLEDWHILSDNKIKI